MKTNIQIKDEPIEISNYSTKTELLNLYTYDQITKMKLKDSIINQEEESSTCAWCQKLGSKSFILHTDNGDSKILCSEICFNQYRRASFKKNKDSKLLKIHQTIETKSTNGSISQKKSKSVINEIEHNHYPDTNQRKIFSPYHPSTQTKSKFHEFSRNLSPLSKRHCSSSSNEQPSSNLPINLNYSTSYFLPPPSIDINRIQYPFFSPSPPIQQMPLSLPSSEHLPSTLFRTLSKGLLSNYTCILPTFIPLPIPIPFCFPIPLPCVKCSNNVINQGCQTDISNNIDSFPIDKNRTRRMSY